MSPRPRPRSIRPRLLAGPAALALAGVVAATVLAPGAAAADTPPARPVTTMWVWDNSIPREVDARGTGYAPAEPATLAAWAAEQGLTTVHLSAPWAADVGVIDPWMTAAVDALRAEGVDVGVLGGDPPWLDEPHLAVWWLQAATRGRTVTHVQMNVEPWTLPGWQTDRAGILTRWFTMLDAAKAALPEGVGLGVDVPYWLAWEPAPGGGTVAEAVFARADSVGIVTFVDHAQGHDGILTLSADAVAQAVAAGVPFTIGVETDTPAVAGGAEWTFGDDDPAVLTAEVQVVHDALVATPGYRGVSVQHYRTWRELVGATP
ncbi:hypothetical protein [Cellulomonas shaoxiangyii]|uniref:Sugar phosphate isomerase/epimerase n=1 Tax=Cellulomonas shaoxiangyii TaxID=2566013 RepID=A0A4P7SJK1_9CELL|nr:hypothetical protein [Cellulomonas shaoxiangyii]QCB92693.1 hypothetical protein E5225_03125 [Cellulomonas shaoxiangyii]TGY85818.1 hypothetical protein E5226_04570 [Cellulomonas shaoxiangyii]